MNRLPRTVQQIKQDTNYAPGCLKPGMFNHLNEELLPFRQELVESAAYRDASHPDHKAVCADVARLYETQFEDAPEGLEIIRQGDPNDSLSNGGGW